MKVITKGLAPVTLTAFIAHNPNVLYHELRDHDAGPQVKSDIRNSCLTEQHYICAYCCCSIDHDNSHNEHIIARHTSPQLSMTYTNFVASCNGKHHCGMHKKAYHLPITPLHASCETDIKYYLSGAAVGLTDDGRKTIDVLGLDTEKLTAVRKDLVNSLIYTIGENPADIGLLDNELLGLLIEDLSTPSAQNRLEAFSPVLVRILQDFIT
ncbi:hypothetical protein [Flavobacterium notoginsengisoli]|uniref:hypothetical protein n=1 Tax=Flavobacterium notoginsengisoli TaxID=1478199 RepID=UPI00364570AD